MFIILKKDWEVIDAATGKKVVIRKGRHEIELIADPFGRKAKSHWIVLKGTKIGAPEGAWLSWSNPVYGKFQVIIKK